MLCKEGPFCKIGLKLRKNQNSEFEKKKQSLLVLNCDNVTT